MSVTNKCSLYGDEEVCADVVFERESQATSNTMRRKLLLILATSFTTMKAILAT